MIKSILVWVTLSYYKHATTYTCQLLRKWYIESVEIETRGQRTSNLWFTFRAGRAKALRTKSVCQTDPANPSQSLVKVIAYPEAFKFTTSATSIINE